MRGKNARFSETVSLHGHILDSLTFSKALDLIKEHGGRFTLQHLDVGQSKNEYSRATLRVEAPSRPVLERLLNELHELGADVRSLPSLTKLLMCAPTHYDVRYEINPWMKIDHPPQRKKAMVQWLRLKHTLERLGANVWTVPQKADNPDMVFTANAGVVSGETFIPSHFRFAERRGEEPAFAAYFKRKGFRVRDVAKGTYFEGEGDLLPYRDMLFGGFRFRSSIAAHERVSRFLNKRLISLDLVQPSFYHLDTCFCPLDERSAFYYPQAFDAYGRQVIKRFVTNPIAVGHEDARAFACNAIRIGRTIVLNKASRRLKGQLAALGYKTVETPTSEFMKAGGSVKCLVLKL